MRITSRAAVRHLSLISFALVLSTAGLAQSPGWLQYGGPNSDFKNPATGLAKTWPETGPPKIWSREMGEGYSGIAVQGDQLFTMYRRKDDHEVAISLDAKTGKTLWEYPYHAPFLIPEGIEGDIYFDLSQGPGPHAMPTVVGNRVFTQGVTGWLHCFDAKTGKVLWVHNLFTRFKAAIKPRGYATSPLAYKNMLIVPVGARGAGLVAFNQEDGSVIWQKHDFQTAYSTPRLIQIDGQTQLVAFMRQEIVGVDPENGELFWSHPAPSSNGTHVSMPVWSDEDNLLFYSAAYGLGGHVLKLTREGRTTKVEELWHNPKVRLHFSNAIRLGDVIYGSTGDFGPAFFTAVDVRTGNILWQDRALSRTGVLWVEDRLIILDEDGKLALATPSPQGLTIHSVVELMTRNAWTMPTVIGKTMYIRDRKIIMSLDLS